MSVADKVANFDFSKRAIFISMIDKNTHFLVNYLRETLDSLDE